MFYQFRTHFKCRVFIVKADYDQRVVIPSSFIMPGLLPKIIL